MNTIETASQPVTDHQKKFEAFAQQIGINTIKSMVTERIGSAEMLRACHGRDKHLNNISLSKWDALDSSMRPLARGKGIKDWPLSYSVCTAKHVAIYHVAGISFEAGE
jgi:hypothetical protein